LIAAVVLGAGAAGVGHDAGAQSTDADLATVSNRYFSSTTNVHLAGTATALWAAVLGVPRNGGHGLVGRVFARGVQGGWSVLPAPPGGVGQGVEFDVAENMGRPCLKYLDGHGRPRIPCWTGTVWRSLRLGGAFASGLQPESFTSYRRRPAVVLYGHARTRAVRWTGHRWARIGADFRGARRGLFGQVVGGGLTLSIEATRAAHRVRVVFELRHVRWRRVATVRLHTSGPSISGPIVQGDSALTAVIEARGNDWPLYAVVARGDSEQVITGGALNEGRGAAQGAVGTAAGQAWAVWQQNAQRRDGLFDTRILLRRIDIAGAAADPSRTLWTGISNGPGDVQVIDALGTAWVAYMPARTSSGKREVAIEPLMGPAVR
jgi:hypothetical protein